MGRKILIVEDDAGLREMISKMLEMLGFEVIEAEDGSQGLQLATSRNIDIIISDVNMPVMDGFTMLTKLNEIKTEERIPFIFLTSNTEREQLRKGMSMGADDYITKPFNYEELFEAIKTQLKKKIKIDQFIEQKLQKRYQDIEDQIYRDEITGLPNKNALFEHCKKLQESVDDYLISLHLIDIIGFEEIANFISQNSLNNVTTSIIEALKKCLLQNSQLYQIEKNEYVILYENDEEADEKKMENIANKVVHQIHQPIGSTDFNLIFKTAIGMAYGRIKQKKEVSDLLKQAQIAKDYALKIGTCEYQFYNKMVEKKLKDFLRTDIKQFIQLNEQKRKAPSETGLDNYEVKVFFLYPPGLIQDVIIKEIIGHEYAALILKDHKKAVKILKKYNHSILFVNIDTVLTEPQWQDYIKGLLNDPETENIRIGILSYKEDQEVMKTYLIKIMVPCGYIQLKLGIKESSQIILKALEANEARGMRKFIRAKCKNIPSVSFSIKLNNQTYKGSIHDISSSGMAAIFDQGEEVFIKENTILNDLQLQLRGRICFISGKIAIKREDKEGRLIYVILFTDVDAEDKEKIHDFIYQCLQEKIDEEMETL